ncbi:MAG: hypothetical protein ABIW76_06530 [Fibrobacteria bacterium]
MKELLVENLTVSYTEEIRVGASALGFLREEHKAGFSLIWKYTHDRLKARVEE